MNNTKTLDPHLMEFSKLLKIVFINHHLINLILKKPIWFFHHNQWMKKDVLINFNILNKIQIHMKTIKLIDKKTNKLKMKYF